MKLKVITKANPYMRYRIVVGRIFKKHSQILNFKELAEQLPQWLEKYGNVKIERDFTEEINFKKRNWK